MSDDADLDVKITVRVPGDLAARLPAGSTMSERARAGLRLAADHGAAPDPVAALSPQIAELGDRVETLVRAVRRAQDEACATDRGGADPVAARVERAVATAIDGAMAKLVEEAVTAAMAEAVVRLDLLRQDMKAQRRELLAIRRYIEHDDRFDSTATLSALRRLSDDLDQRDAAALAALRAASAVPRAASGTVAAAPAPAV